MQSGLSPEPQTQLHVGIIMDGNGRWATRRRLSRLRGHEAFYGPAGGGATDDLEMFERNQIGLSARVDPWLVLARGRQQEYRDVDRTIVGQITDEVTQRGIWRQWKKVMSQGVDEDPARLDGNGAGTSR